MKDQPGFFNMSTQTKLSLGAVLATVGALSIFLSLLQGWPEAVGSWALLLGFVTGVVTGLGAALAIAGLIERRRGNGYERIRGGPS